MNTPRENTDWTFCLTTLQTYGLDFQLTFQQDGKYIFLSMYLCAHPLSKTENSSKNFSIFRKYTPSEHLYLHLFI